ncbi:hypothetical protein Patl1_07713 [Pistacia atlantica]|uniref:Uncharacterized protein n=1 Tax=Pistacia atlantica TaxID=434234 RepID=A0ACC1ALJ6_9ROSI|nr:hypothetical protein Patl1_07713 [Pistacia atlantica]
MLKQRRNLKIAVGMAAVLKEEFNIGLRVLGIIGSRNMLLSDWGIDFLKWRELLKEKGEVADLNNMCMGIISSQIQLWHFQVQAYLLPQVIILATESGLKLELSDLPVHCLCICQRVHEANYRQFDQELAKETQEAEDAGEVLRYIGVVDAVNQKGMVQFQRYKKENSVRLVLAM